MAPDAFPALPGFYRLLFLYLEPISTITPAVIVWLSPGASWFYHQLIPSDSPVPALPLDPRTRMAVWQLTNCYLLLGMISSFVFRAIRDALPDNPVAQERILGASFLALGLADISTPTPGNPGSQLTHIFATFLGLPADLKFAPARWNGTTHGNITVDIFLFLFRYAWYAGIGRKRYYFGVPSSIPGKKL